MPLSAPADRDLTHLRDIVLRGYRRADGLFDIEAQIVDTKPYGFTNQDRGYVAPGEPLHGMSLRMTVDEAMTIAAFEAVTDYAPYAICPQAAPNFSRLAGMKIARGFVRAANERVGGVHGCTHLRELLQQMATVAFQTLYSERMRRATAAAAANGEALSPVELERRSARDDGGRPAVLGTCFAYAPDSPVVRRRWPQLGTGSLEVKTGEAAGG